MELAAINELTRIAYDSTASKYHDNFKDEVHQKEYDRLLLDRFSDLLPVDALICDAGCGPSGHIGQYLVAKGKRVVGIDISQQCVAMAASYNPQMEFAVVDIMNTDFKDETFDAIVSFYSIIHTPKAYIDKIFAEFRRILKVNGKLLIVVKKGINEGIIDDEWYEGNKIYFAQFIESEMREYFSASNFTIEFFDVRKPYDFEFNVERIYAIGTKAN